MMSFRCFIIGEGTLPVQCGEILLRGGHTIAGVISSESGVVAWAREHRIATAPADVDLPAFLGDAPFEYLFSIVNFRVIPDAVLARPTRGAINFHDGPLPKYAGSFATSWAIAAGERTHGVTWHLMTAAVDGGDILAQSTFEILDSDTAVTLNAKCYQVAITAFGTLVADLANESVRRVPQDAGARTYFARRARPEAAAVLSWDKTPAQLGALIRSLDFGQYRNPLATPKVLIGTEFIAVGSLQPEARSSGAEPGTLMSIGPDAMTVAVNGGDVALRDWRTLDGRAVAIDAVVARQGLHVGERLPQLKADEALRLRTVSEVLAPHESFWERLLRQPEPAAIPFASPMGAPRALRSLPLAVPAKIATALRTRHSRSGLSDGIVAALAIYLARVTGMEVLDVGRRVEPTGSAADPRMFASHVPWRLAIRREVTFDETVDALRRQAAELAHRGTFARDLLIRSPQLRAGGEMQARGRWPIVVDLTQEDALVESAEAQLYLRMTHDGTDGLLTYDPGAIGDNDAERIRWHLLTLLDSATGQPECPVGRLPVVADAERRQLLCDWNETRREYPHDTPFHRLFEAQVLERPEAIAASFERQELTYSELNRRANQLAHYLVGLGVEPGALVGVCVDRSLQMLVAVLGIMKAGGAYVPLDPGFPRDRLAFMADDARLQWVVAEEITEALVSASGRVIVRLDRDAEAVGVGASHDPTVQVSPDGLVYVLYTSGSTGRPKGVEVPHRALTNFLWAMRSEPGCAPHDTVLALTTLSFDIAGLELYLPLISGAKVEIVSRRTAADGRLLQTCIERAGVTLMQATPATWRMLLGTGWRGTPGLRALCGGEGLPPDLARALVERTGALWNMYGPTETTIWSSIQRVRQDDVEITVGRPIANTEFYVLDAGLEPVPIGVPGELFIGGDGLARGYRNRPELTAERFVPHPFLSGSSRLYRTGDLAVCRADGQIVHLGRLDHQVKLRGFRIELGEIEASLSSHPSVQAVAVVARDADRGADAFLAAYIVAREGRDPTAGQLREFLQNSLPDYMIPSAFVFLEALPLTPNGKIDRKALPVPQHGRARLASTYVAPRTPIEVSIVALWEAALKVDRVGIHDNFFELGGHSLSGLEISVRIGESLGVEIPLQVMFEYPTCATLAARVEQALFAQTDDVVLEQLLAQMEQADRAEARVPGVIADSSRVASADDVA